METARKYQTQTGPTAISAGAFQQSGSRNHRRQGACGSVLLVRETPEFCFYGLADAQNGNTCGRTGGNVCLNTVYTVIHSWGIGAMADSLFPDEFPCMLMREIRESIRSLIRRRGGVFPDYASTLLAIAVDPVTGKYVLVHLGNGCGVGVRVDNSIVIISPPENTAAPHFTTSPIAVRHLQLGFGSVNSMKRVILLSNGADRLCNGKNIPRKANALFTRGTQAEIYSYLKASKPSDDAGCIVLDIGKQP